MKRARRYVVSIVSLLACLPSAARAGDATLNDFGAWFMVLGQGDLGGLNPKLGKLRWWFDGQARLLEDSNGYDQSLLRPGLGYAVTEKASVWLGYAWVHTSPTGRASFAENRIWQQLLWSNRFERVGFLSRTRLEQRFVENGDDTGWRFRQFFKLTYPFAFAPRLGLAGYEELFFDLNDTDWGANAGFAQNRFFAGASWMLDSTGRATAEIGYLNQFLRNPGRSNAMNHIVSINLLLNFK